MEPALEKFGNYGAADTEPLGVARQALVDFAKMKVFGHTKDAHPEFADEMY
jgi:hypothetical protein